MKRLFYTLTVLLILSCNNSGNSSNPITKATDSTIKNKASEIDSTNRSNQVKLVSDTVKRIIDELKLCNDSDWPCDINPNKNCCYEEDVCWIRNIKPGDNSYNNFVLELPGGSGGDNISVYCKKKGKYQEVQYDVANVDSILPTTTKGFYDLIIWHRAHKVDGEFALYKWNGGKYIRVKELPNYKKDE